MAVLVGPGVQSGPHLPEPWLLHSFAALLRTNVGGWQLSAPIYTQGNPCSLEVRSDTQGPTAKLQSRDSKLSLLVPNFAHPAGSQEYAEEHHGHRKGQSGRAGALLKQKALS